MELYTLIIINNNLGNLNILNYGLFHSINLVYYLKLLNFEVIYYDGINENIFDNKFNLDQLDSNKSCINLDINKINFNK